MVKRILGIAILFISTLVTIALSINIGTTPPLGELINPFQGFWSNIDLHPDAQKEVEILAPNQTAHIIYDEKNIPHIFAANEEDLYYTQGYIMAKDRLWQMEFITYAAAGRLTEIAGDKALELDRYNRRIGMKKAAEKSVETMRKDPNIQKIVDAFCAGVNQFISEAKRDKLPVEYKLMGYRPEKWTPLHSALLLKYMANDLTGRDNDIEYTNALKKFGREIFDALYPDFPETLDPIIPANTPFNFKALLAPTHPSDNQLSAKALYHNPLRDFLPPKGLGSNNWVVSGSKTASNMPILCNDPHLMLTFPSIWYEMQLSAPGLNVYGVTLPGAPGIVIGYNENIAWGVTNAEMDVRDWYTVERNPKNAKEYKINGQWKPFEENKEVYKIKGKKDFTENIKWTEIGPVVYDKDYDVKKDKMDLAMSWTALNGSNDLKTFYMLNHAKNHQDYLKALDNYWCPAQNFVYADIHNNIAIKEQGRFWVRYPEQGKFIQNLSTANIEQIKSYFIPNNQTPYSLNPTIGFLHSANQIPVDKSYPYYVFGAGYENYRNRRINEVLSGLQKITPEDMKKLQYDNVSIHAREALPIMLSYVAKVYGNTEVFQDLSKWNYVADYNSVAASYFYKWWDYLEKIAWDELASTDSESFVYPEEYTTVTLMKTQPKFALFDIQGTSKKEELSDILKISLDSTISYFENHPEEKDFSTYKNTSITHLARINAFSMTHIKIGGYRHIVNATSSRWGSSVRFIIDFKNGKVQGYGMYPGGESGNPGSKAYNNFVQDWIEGNYHTHHFYQNLEEAKKSISQ